MAKKKKKNNFLLEIFGNDLTDNFSANVFFLAVITALYIISPFANKVIDSKLLYKISYLDNKSSLVNYLYFVLFYMFAAYWFSPDLDIRNNRPGKHSFPLGPLFKLTFTIGDNISPLARPMALLHSILNPFHKSLNIMWNYYWKPLSLLFTHRGVVHWPIIGTIVKLLYVYLSYLFIFNLLNLIDLYLINISIDFDKYLIYLNYEKLLYLLKNNKVFLVFVLSVMLSDTLHSFIDAIDSFKKGSNFVPPEGIAPRGLFYKIFFSFQRFL